MALKGVPTVGGKVLSGAQGVPDGWSGGLSGAQGVPDGWSGGLSGTQGVPDGWSGGLSGTQAREKHPIFWFSSHFFVPYIFANAPWAEFCWNILMGTGFDEEHDLETKLFPVSKLPISGLLRIGNKAFANCRNMKSFSIPSSVSIVADNAFFQCYSMQLNFY